MVLGKLEGQVSGGLPNHGKDLEFYSKGHKFGLKRGNDLFLEAPSCWMVGNGLVSAKDELIRDRLEGYYNDQGKWRPARGSPF